ncbi:oligosaccharyl transferase, putative [Entamoeba invadens IP1]|uniref:dolichyl-diphosphooligosaccharide--protein glycotransferase n=1 Tax=Entamoeba invadens IP1 TaxID=370355 RepID=A0A0A1U6U8_ENTIV|nr:oligosaccharyl transferase, putative [Entamoeba invadens IP1]ELP90050.1 oligosaccharyl transferase, putative [Entamoeba invadens IP1]|eukprot:XP_004256821.1 oligosaccharyl transferase, putative [Entamoeba invadens IP1]
MGFFKTLLQLILKNSAITIICVIAFSSRLYSIVKYEAIIHEFDPYFNFRATKYLVEHGPTAFMNWFDPDSWYPLGRNIGTTVFPGLMFTSAFIFKFLAFFNLIVDVRLICVCMGPIYSVITCITAYLFGSRVHSDKAGLFAAALISVVPGYMSRSVAGSFDYECISITILVLTLYLWIEAVHNNSPILSAMTALSYFYMASSWGAYVFINNIIPLHVLISIFCGYYSKKLYSCYSIYYIFATILSMQIPFINYVAIRSSEHIGAFGVFGICQLIELYNLINKLVGQKKILEAVKKGLLMFIGFGIVAVIVLIKQGYISAWSGRFYALFDPTFAKKNVPLIVSVSEHQPANWASYFFDLHVLIVIAPAGLYYCFKKFDFNMLFLIIYSVSVFYFSCVMSRLVLILAPAICLLSGIALAEFFTKIEKQMEKVLKIIFTKKEEKEVNASEDNTEQKVKKAIQKNKEKKEEKNAFTETLGFVLMAIVGVLLVIFLFKFFEYSIQMSNNYSSPSVVLYGNNGGKQITFDDYREAYRWLAHNTPEGSRIMSWWDYGYQISHLGNRTVIVDNNTWNNTHISLTGNVMASREEVSMKTIRDLDVDYLLVVFGGYLGYSSDDINKFMWMIRIGAGVNPSLDENNYFNRGQYTVGNPTDTFKYSMMYKMCYHNFYKASNGYRPGMDNVRREMITEQTRFNNIEEAFTSKHWVVRIYKVLKPNAVDSLL